HRRPRLTAQANPILRSGRQREKAPGAMGPCFLGHLPFPGAIAHPKAPRQLKAPPGRPTFQMVVTGLPARARGMLEVRGGPYCPLRLPDSAEGHPHSIQSLIAWMTPAALLVRARLMALPPPLQAVR